MSDMDELRRRCDEQAALIASMADRLAEKDLALEAQRAAHCELQRAYFNVRGYWPPRSVDTRLMH